MNVIVPVFQAYVSSLPANALPHLELQLDHDHAGVDTDLCEIADVMLNWDEGLHTHLGLTRVKVHDIKVKYPWDPKLQRQDSL